MARQKKIKDIQIEEKQEAQMSESQTLESLETEIDKARLELEKTKLELEEKKKELSKSSREINEDEAVIVKKQIAVSSEKAALKAKIERQKQYDNEQVTGKFINRRAPGMSAKLTYMHYEDDPVKWYTFEDGKVYTIPRGFANEINDYYHTPHFVQKQGEMDANKPSSSIHHVDTSNKKYAFVPVNF